MRVPRSWTALALCASLAGACEKKEETPAPRGRRAAGETCLEDKDCVHKLTCYGGRCLEPTQAEAAREKLALFAARARQREEQRKERELLQQSGAAPAVPAERPPPGEEAPRAPAPGSVQDRTHGAVRVATTSGDAPIFAACRADERLIGGGCRVNSTINASVRASHPSHFGRDDTLGARWSCDGESSYTKIPLEAFALCQPARPR